MSFKPTILFLPLLLLTACSPSDRSAGNEEQTAEVSAVNFLDEAPEAFNQRMDWWRDATFGMFIHWGPYAVPAGMYKGKPIEGIGEWIMNSEHIPVAEYEQFSKQFNPTAYHADEWVRIAKEAGVKYIIITSKHHDGFALWDSKVGTYDVMDYAPIKRDLLGELKAACDKQGMKLGFYHSIMDWHHPDAQAPHYPDYNTDKKSNPKFQNYVNEYLKPQVKELIEKYDPVVLWFDGEWVPEWTHENGLDMYQFCRGLKPDILVNNRVDKGRKGMQGMNAEDQQYAGDFGTPEQEILEGTSTFDWESCMTMNDTWGFKQTDNNWKSAENLIHNLIDISAKGGNYLLNVGPTAEGLIPAPSVERLGEMGKWLATNGEAIYATNRLTKFKEGDSIYYTKSKDGAHTYALLTAWPKNGQLRLTQVSPAEGSDVSLLGFDQPLSWKKDGKATVVTLPALAQKSSKYAWVLRLTQK